MIVLFSVLGTALGGALGALSRWKLDLAVKTRWIEKRAPCPVNGFPWRLHHVLNRGPGYVDRGAGSSGPRRNESNCRRLGERPRRLSAGTWINGTRLLSAGDRMSCICRLRRNSRSGLLFAH